MASGQTATALHRLWQCKEVNGWSDATLARQLVVSRMTIYRWRYGKAQPFPGMVERIKRFAARHGGKA